jgi:hypothetical protein
MRHLATVSRKPAYAVDLVPGGTSLEIKMNGILDIMDRVLLAQRQAAWKTPFPIGGITTTTTTTPTTTPTTPTIL